MKANPDTWQEVPDAVLVRFAALRKEAADEPGWWLPRQMADVLGWRAGPLNAWRGGPRPLTNALTGAVLGALAGRGIGWAADKVLPDEYFEDGSLKRRGTLAGGILGAVPGAVQYADTIAAGHGPLESLLTKWPPKTKNAIDLTDTLAVKEAQARLLPGPGDFMSDMFSPNINRDHFNRVVWNDPRTPPPIAAGASGLVSGASAMRGGADLVSPFDVARVAIGAGSGLLSGLITGKVIGTLAGLTPKAQKDIQRAGIWTGFLQNVVPAGLGI